MGDPVCGPWRSGWFLDSGPCWCCGSKGEKRAEINSYIGRTRAIRPTPKRVGLSDELATMRATFAANGQRPGVGTMAIFNEVRKQRGCERRIDYGNRMAEVADWKMQGKNAQAKASSAIMGGIIKAGPSLFDLYQYKKGP